MLMLYNVSIHEKNIVHVGELTQMKCNPKPEVLGYRSCLCEAVQNEPFVYKSEYTGKYACLWRFMDKGTKNDQMAYHYKNKFILSARNANH